MTGRPDVVESAAQATLGRGHRLPYLELRDSDGQPFDLAVYRGRNNLLLVLAAGADRMKHFLHSLAERDSDFKQEETQVIVILPQDRTARRREASPFAVLTAPAAHRSLGALAPSGEPCPAIVITDRWREVYAAWIACAEEPLPTVAELLEWARFINMQCEECFPPEWPAT